MLDIYFKYRGRNSREMGIEAESFFEVGEAVPNVEQITVPGRSGALTYWDGTYANRPITAPSFLLSEILPRDIEKINTWLLSSQSYDKLVLSNDPEHFFLARAVAGVSENVRADLLTPFTLEFDALPQKFLEAGTEESTAGANIYNPTDFTAFPIWKINATGNVTLTVGQNTATITGITGQIVLDTETGTATKDGTNVSAYVSFAEDLTLAPGNNAVSIRGGTLRYIPRWWTL